MEKGKIGLAAELGHTQPWTSPRAKVRVAKGPKNKINSISLAIKMVENQSKEVKGRMTKEKVMYEGILYTV